MRTALALVLAGILLPALFPALAGDSPLHVVRVENVVTLDEKGDAGVELRLRYPSIKVFHDIKQQYPNPYALLRFNFNDNLRAVFRDADIRYDDQNRGIVMHAVSPGAAAHRRGRWQITIDAGFHLALAEDGIAIFYGDNLNPPAAIHAVTLKYILPTGSGDVSYDERTQTLSYTLPPVETSGGRGRLAGDLVAREYLMSAVSKLYGDPKLLNGAMWAGKAVLKNDGDGDVSDLHISYRLGEFSDWSPESRYDLVPPGGTVIDCYYPVLNSRTMLLNNPTPVYLEMKYSYQDGSGNRREESITERCSILGRTSFLYSNLPKSEAVSWLDRFSNAPLLAAFVTRFDPVLREFAGIVSQASGGAGAVYSDKEALDFIKALYDQMVANGISYQSPVGFLTESASLNQDFKYPRDVLRDKAGTCIELAILFSAVCESNGLKTGLVLVPGHCFTVVELPSGTVIPVENTGVLGAAVGKSISFEKAVEAGKENLAKAKPDKLILLQVADLQTAGITPPDLPELPADVLKSWDITLRLPNKRTPPQPTPPQPTPGQPAGSGSGDDESRIFGVWRLDGVNRANNAPVKMEIGLFTKDSGRQSYFGFAGTNESFPIREARLVDGNFEIECHFNAGGEEHVVILNGPVKDGKWEGKFSVTNKAAGTALLAGPFAGARHETGEAGPPPSVPAGDDPYLGAWELAGVNRANGVVVKMAVELLPRNAGRPSSVRFVDATDIFPLTKVEANRQGIRVECEMLLAGNAHLLVLEGKVEDGIWEGEFTLVRQEDGQILLGGPFAGKREGAAGGGGTVQPRPPETPPGTMLDGLAGNWDGAYGPKGTVNKLRFEITGQPGTYRGTILMPDDNIVAAIAAIGMEGDKLVMVANWRSAAHGDRLLEIRFVGGVFENGWGGEFALAAEGTAGAILSGIFGVLREGSAPAVAGGGGGSAGGGKEKPVASGLLCGYWDGSMRMMEKDFPLRLNVEFVDGLYQGEIITFGDQSRHRIDTATDVNGDPAVVMTTSSQLEDQPFSLSLMGAIDGDAFTGKCFVHLNGKPMQGTFTLRRR